jgi:UDP-glucose 4-epimerase
MTGLRCGLSCESVTRVDSAGYGTLLETVVAAEAGKCARACGPQRQLNPRETAVGNVALILGSMSQRRGRVVVTGGAGFIGSHLVDRLLTDDCAEVVVLDNLSRGRLSNLAQWHGDPRLDVVHGDVRDAATVDELIRGADVVYQLAAQSTVMGGVQDMSYTFSTNVVGTFNVLSSAARGGVRRVVFASSREVYGEPISLPVDEDSPLLAINSYGASKAAGEAYCRAFRREYGLQSSVLRLANVYGTRDIGRVIPLWVGDATAGRDLTVYGGKQVIDFVWVGHAVEALIRGASYEGPMPPINIGSGTGTRIIDLARRIARLAETHGRLNLQPARSVEVTRFIANVQRMREILKVEPPLDPLGQLATLIAAPVGAGG